MAEADTRIETLEDAVKVLKGEVRRSLVYLRSLLIREDSPLNAAALSRRAAPPDSFRSTKARFPLLFPSRAFEFFFVDENFDRLYENENRLSAVTSSFAILAIMIACLGLFALASLIVTQRTKEIGVRKILGASVLGIVLLLTGVFTRLVGLAFILACPISYFAANKWLADFAYRTDLGIEIFMLAGLLSIVISFFTVSYHSVKAAVANPVEALRYE